MAQTPNTWNDYVGDGVEDTFQVTFPYQKQREVFVTVDGAPAAFTFISAGWVQLAVAPASGAAIRVQRSTEAFEPQHEFANGVPLLPRFIDENNKQFLYVVQEVVNETAGVVADALSAAEGAVGIAQTASGKADAAVGIAQTAAGKVDAAVIESASQLRLDLSNAIDPEKGAKLIGYKGRTVAQKLDELGLVSSVSAFARSTAPAGWLKANGAAVSRTTYADLFAAIGTTFGAGDGSTTFNLPDLRGEFLRGWDDARGVDSGRTFGSWQDSDNKSHTHTASTESYTHTHTWSGTTSSNGVHTHTVTGNNSGSVGGASNQPATGVQNGSARTVITVDQAGAHTHTVSGTTSSDSHTHTVTVNATGDTEARPRNLALLFCIKY